MKKTMLVTILLSLFLTSVAVAQPPDIIWTQTYPGGGSNDRCYSVKETSDGGFIQTGYTNDIGAGGTDVWLIKTDALGNEIWNRTFGGTDNDKGYSVAETSDGGYIITGGTLSYATAGGFDVWLIKTNSSGDTLWTKTLGRAGDDWGNSVAQTSDGGYIITGYSAETQGQVSDVILIKTDSSGDETWTRIFSVVPDYNEEGFSVAQTSDDGYIITGFTHGDVWLIKTDSSGDETWTRTFYESEESKGYSVAQTFDGGYIITGYCGDWRSDVLLIKTSSSGDTLWTKTFGEGSYDKERGHSVAQTPEGGYIITGFIHPLDKSKGKEVWLIKTNSSGDEVWTKKCGFNCGLSVALTSDGGYVITGQYAGWLVKVKFVGDFNSDGYVDGADLLLFGDHWHFIDTDPGWDALYDLVPDGIIDAGDLQVFGDHWHEGTPPKSDEGGNDGKGPNEFAGIVFDLDRTTYGNQNLTSIPSQPAGTYIPVDVYCTGVQNLDTYEFEVIYDPTELEYVTAVPTNPITHEPNILTTNGGTALGWMIDTSTPGVLSIAYTLAGNDPAQAPEGEGLIADIVFLSLVDTYGTLTFGDVYYYDSYGVVDLITDTGTATLPVELSSFTASYNTVSGFVSLCWATASETDVNGFNIYRNTEDSFIEADKINVDLIAGSGTTTETTEYSFTDETADPYYTTYYYWLEVINFGGTPDKFGPYQYIPIDVNNNGELDIITSALSPCYPNPARIGNEIKFNFRVGGLEGTARNVELKVYNILGKLVAEVVNGERLVNDYTETWNPENLSNGVYFYQLKTDNYSEVKKMLIQ
ncbi:MAG: T9SS type A sorting domain-containing protein [Candidatus Cloacimonetes bacterium]|nr:T9SS type A sorting domain-containing protein [Candidatus Cloacimonadota bacterium]